jgi:hypothetical protein
MKINEKRSQVFRTCERLRRERESIRTLGRHFRGCKRNCQQQSSSLTGTQALTLDGGTPNRLLKDREKWDISSNPTKI